MADTCPTCGSDSRETIRHRHYADYAGAHKWRVHPDWHIADHDGDREDCADAWHDATLEAPTAIEVFERLCDESLMPCSLDAFREFCRVASEAGVNIAADEPLGGAR